MECKITGKKINSFISFGQIPSANSFLEKKSHFKFSPKTLKLNKMLVESNAPRTHWKPSGQ